jgi:hypothetical protein
MTREPLADRRAHELIDVVYAPKGRKAIPITLGLGRFADGAVAEVFLSQPKALSTDMEAEALLRDATILISKALEHGAPFAALQTAMTREDDDTPSSIVGCVLDAMAGRP